MNQQSFLQKTANGCKYFLHVLFPVSCPICGRLGETACPECLDSLCFNRNVRCFECGLECPCVLHENGAWIYHYARHRDAARELVLSLKYTNQESLGRAMGECIGRALLRDNEELVNSYDKGSVLLVPIPLHLNSKRRFNQSAAIASGISRVLGFKVSEALSRPFDVNEQTAGSRKERLSLAEDAFKADPKKLSGKKVILVDDVLTTGTTLKRALSACAAAGAGIGEICSGAIVWSRS